MLAITLGFFIALSVGLTGIGGGAFTTPALVLLLNLPAAAAVGAALAYSAVLRLLAAPAHLMARNVKARCFWPLLLGGVPGLAIGTLSLRHFSREHWGPRLLVVLGAVLIFTGVASLWAARPNRGSRPPARPKRLWLALVAAPIGWETGFSSAGAGALGMVALLHFSDLSTAEAVGTNLMFGAVLSIAGAVSSAAWGIVPWPLVIRMLAGGIPGVLLGTGLGRRLHAQHLRSLALATILLLGLVLVWNGLSPSFSAPPVAAVAPLPVR